MLFKLFILLGAGVLAVALRSFQSSFSQKSGAIAILVVSYLLVYFATDSPVLGAVAAAAWFFLPWLVIRSRFRSFRFPTENLLRPVSSARGGCCPSHNYITRRIY